MRNLLGASLALLVGAGGCVIVEDDGYYDDGYYEEPALITARWQFTDLATTTDTGCPAGFDTVGLHSQAIDGGGRPIGPLVIDLYDCVDGIGTSDFLYPDVYQSWIDVTDFDRKALYAESTSATVDVIERDATLDVEILNDGGYFATAWNLVGAATNKNLTCSEIGATTIHLSSATSRTMESDQFVCDDHFGVTAGFLAGDHSIQLTAFAGESAITEPVTLENKTIRDRNRITDLGSVSIPIANR